MIPENPDNEQNPSLEPRPSPSNDPEDNIQPPTYHVVTEGYDPKQIKRDEKQQNGKK